MKTYSDKQLDYIQSFIILKSLLRDDIISKHQFEELDILNARATGTVAISIESHNCK